MNLAAYLLTLILPDINQQQAFAGLSAVMLTIKAFMIMSPTDPEVKRGGSMT